MDLKKVLKTIKLHQEQISIVFGVIFLLVAAAFIIHYVKNINKENQILDTTTTQSQSNIHTVAKGETLWSISEKYYENGSDWKIIADANNITSPSKLEVGDKLTIPTSTEVPVPTNSPAEPTTVPTPVETSTPSPEPQITDVAASTDSAITGANYVVVKGDSLWKIAVRAYGDGYKWVEIAKANNLKNPNIIHKGNVFIIPR